MNPKRVFLSHNRADRPLARRIGANLVLVGGDVWFDEWEIAAGDSIPGALDKGLESFEWFVIVWSKHAERSRWVRSELDAAIVSAVANESAKIVPCLVDDTPLPPLISSRRGVDFRNEARGLEVIANEFLGKSARKARLLAIQQVLTSLDIDEGLIHDPAAGTYICCPACGETGTLEGWQQTDSARGDTYAGLRCTACGWCEGSEI